MIPDAVQKLLADNKSGSSQEDSLRIMNMEIMKVVGGYTNFLSLPLSAYLELSRALVAKNKLDARKFQAMANGLGGGL